MGFAQTRSAVDEKWIVSSRRVVRNSGKTQRKFAKIMQNKGNFDFIYNPIKEKMRELVTPITYTTYIEKIPKSV